MIREYLNRFLLLKLSAQIFYLSTILVLTALVFSNFIGAQLIQDDYSALWQLSTRNLQLTISDYWNFHGGNFVPLFFNLAAVSSSVSNLNFLTSGIFGIITFLLVAITSHTLITTFSPIAHNKISLFLVFLSLLGFQGAFSPGIANAYFFVSASLVHLWPICAFIMVYVKLYTKKMSAAILLPTGIIIGNCNISESLFILTCLVLAFFFHVRSKTIFFNKTLFGGIKNICILFIGCTLGTLMIVLSPGFWNRAIGQTQSGLPSNPIIFFERFIKSFVIYSGDLFTHPVVLVAFIFGLLAHYQLNLNVGRRKVYGLLGVFLLLFFCLILGSTFAYPAWHQSVAIYIFVPQVAFLLGVEFGSQKARRKLSSKFLVIILAALFALQLSLVVDAEVRLLKRADAWKRLAELNFCTIQSGHLDGLKGTEIVYPIFGLGIEDVEHWPWMKSAYITWVKNEQQIGNLKCSSLD